jgi:hypothetical protein
VEEVRTQLEIESFSHIDEQNSDICMICMVFLLHLLKVLKGPLALTVLQEPDLYETIE